MCPVVQDNLLYPETLGKGPLWNIHLDLIFPGSAPSESIPMKILTNIADINESNNSVLTLFFYEYNWLLF